MNMSLYISMIKKILSFISFYLLFLPWKRITKFLNGGYENAKYTQVCDQVLKERELHTTVF